MKNILIIMLSMLTLVGCSGEFQTKFTETSIRAYAEDFDDVSKFSNVYGMWRNNVDTLYIQAGNDEYTDTYLLETMPRVYSTVINSLNKYDMKAYALLNNEVWLTEDDKSTREIRNVLNYNNEFENESFKGININPRAEMTDNQIEVYYRNLEKAKRAIRAHNRSTGDNLILSINVDNQMINHEGFSNIINVIDKVIYEGENAEELLSIMDGHDKSVVVVIDHDKNIFTNDYVDVLKDVNNKLKSFNQYNSFKGFIINDYDNYNDFLMQQKRP